MSDVIITGASRGIGRALALELAGQRDRRLVITARDGAGLGEVAQAVENRGGQALAVPGDLGALRPARALGRQLAETVGPGATLIHNAGMWPLRRVLNPDGLETAFVVNHLGGLELQRPLLEAGRLRRVMVISAGLIALGRFDAARTPTGRDFSVFRTYCTTKLCFAVATRDIASAHPDIDFVVLHPGVVRTDLAGSSGLVGRLLSLPKRAFEAPEACAKRLARILAQERWSPPGEAKWMIEEKDKPWPASAQAQATRQAIRDTTASLALGDRT